ncbi:MAG: hypothetical protein GEU26_04385 [Nitrososphaeraceae archaeon]|nr:hypothetical protein [Nitrososphaeraceae archaeon]
MQKIIQKTWVCTNCSQGFTRMTSARRHNDNLHGGVAMIVRPFEYLNGRLNGSFATPADPLSFRRELTGRKTMDRDDTNRSNSFSITHARQDRFEYQNGASPPSTYEHVPRSFDHTSSHYQSQFKSDYYLLKPSTKLLEMTSKLQELQDLLGRNFSPRYAKEFLAATFLSVDQGGEDSLDERLRYLRKLNRS